MPSPASNGERSSNLAGEDRRVLLFVLLNEDLHNLAAVPVDANIQRRFTASSSVEIHAFNPNKSIKNIDITVACCDEQWRRIGLLTSMPALVRSSSTMAKFPL